MNTSASMQKHVWGNEGNGKHTSHKSGSYRTSWEAPHESNTADDNYVLQLSLYVDLWVWLVSYQIMFADNNGIVCRTATKINISRRLTVRDCKMSTTFLGRKPEFASQLISLTHIMSGQCSDRQQHKNIDGTRWSFYIHKSKHKIALAIRLGQTYRMTYQCQHTSTCPCRYWQKAYWVLWITTDTEKGPRGKDLRTTRVVLVGHACYSILQKFIWTTLLCL